jgi:hypothetical protein
MDAAMKKAASPEDRATILKAEELRRKAFAKFNQLLVGASPNQ